MGFMKWGKERETARMEKQADQQMKRAAKMSSKVGRGGRRAAKAATTGMALRDEAERRRSVQPAPVSDAKQAEYKVNRAALKVRRKAEKKAAKAARKGGTDESLRTLACPQKVPNRATFGRTQRN